jgi:hypothetical protein
MKNVILHIGFVSEGGGKKRTETLPLEVALRLSLSLGLLLSSPKAQQRLKALPSSSKACSQPGRR